MGFINLKIDQRVIDDITDGRTTNNSLERNLLKLGDSVAEQARENTLNASNHSDGVRRQRFRNGEAGRYDTGSLANSYIVKKVRTPKLEIRIGSTDPKFLWHEEGTSSSGWGRGVEAGHMLRNAMRDTVGRGANGRFAGAGIKKF